MTEVKLSAFALIDFIFNLDGGKHNMIYKSEQKYEFYEFTFIVSSE